MRTADVEKGSSEGAYYGTFGGQSSMSQPSAPPIPGTDYQAVPGYPVLGNYPKYATYQAGQYRVGITQSTHPRCEHVAQRPLPFSGLGFGWFLFLLGFFIIGIPWFIGAGIFLFLKHDYRDRTGLIACTVAAGLNGGFSIAAVPFCSGNRLLLGEHRSLTRMHIDIVSLVMNLVLVLHGTKHIPRLKTIKELNITKIGWDRKYLMEEQWNK